MMRVHFRDDGAAATMDVEALTEIQEMFPEAEILTINGVAFQGICGGCGKQILGRAIYREYQEDIKVCEDCCQ